MIEKVISCAKLPSVKCVKPAEGLTVGKEYDVVSCGVVLNKLTNEEFMVFQVVNDDKDISQHHDSHFNSDEFRRKMKIDKVKEETSKKPVHSCKENNNDANGEKYSGARVLEAIVKGKLKIGDKLISNEGRLYEVDLNGNRKPVLFDIEMEEAICFEDLAYSTFKKVVKDKPKYVEFQQAITSGKKFKYDKWDKFYSLEEAFRILGLLPIDDVQRMIHESKWITE